MNEKYCEEHRLFTFKVRYYKGNRYFLKKYFYNVDKYGTYVALFHDKWMLLGLGRYQDKILGLLPGSVGSYLSLFMVFIALYNWKTGFKFG